MCRPPGGNRPKDAARRASHTYRRTDYEVISVWRAVSASPNPFSVLERGTADGGDDEGIWATHSGLQKATRSNPGRIGPDCQGGLQVHWQHRTRRKGSVVRGGRATGAGAESRLSRVVFARSLGAGKERARVEARH